MRGTCAPFPCLMLLFAIKNMKYHPIFPARWHRRPDTRIVRHKQIARPGNLGMHSMRPDQGVLVRLKGEVAPFHCHCTVDKCAGAETHGLYLRRRGSWLMRSASPRPPDQHHYKPDSDRHRSGPSGSGRLLWLRRFRRPKMGLLLRLLPTLNQKTLPQAD